MRGRICDIIVHKFASSGCFQCGAGSRTGQALQFFSWKGGQRPVGPPLVEPRWLAWDPDVTLCALAYEVGPASGTKSFTLCAGTSMGRFQGQLGVL